jgi:hypothetical protein
VTKNNKENINFYILYCNENNLNPLSRIHSWASLVPAAAVTPARIVYTNFVAVKKLVVEISNLIAK